MRDMLFIYGLFRDQGRTLLKDYISYGRDSVKGKIFKVNDNLLNKFYNSPFH